MLLLAVGCYDCLYCLMIVALVACGFWVYLRVLLIIVGVWYSFWPLLRVLWFVLGICCVLISGVWVLRLQCLSVRIWFLCTWYFGCVFWVGLRCLFVFSLYFDDLVGGCGLVVYTFWFWCVAFGYVAVLGVYVGGLVVLVLP